MSTPFKGRRVQVVNTSREDLNGSTGKAVDFNEASGRYTVQLDNGQSVALKPVNLKETEPFTGRRVVVRGTTREELNGSVGTALGYNQSSGRYNVRIDRGPTIALKPEHLEETDQPEPEGVAHSMPSDSPLAANDSPLRRGLYPFQPVRQMLAHLTLDGSPSPYQTISDAADLAEAGAKEQAADLLTSMLRTGIADTQIELMTWSALRQLGVRPGARAGAEVLGATFEVPMGGGVDTLAAYRSGAVRYFSSAGPAVILDDPPPALQVLIDAFIDSAARVREEAEPRTDLSLPPHVQVSLLTRSGLFATMSVNQQICTSALQIQMQLMNGYTAAQQSQRRRDSVAHPRRVQEVDENTLICKMCGEVLDRSKYADAEWAAGDADVARKATCMACRDSMDGALASAAAACPASREAIYEAAAEGFHGSVLQHVAQSMGDGITAASLVDQTRRKYDSEADCPICSFPYKEDSVMVIRPCCQQAICSLCNHACHSNGKPCAFCRDRRSG
mmetsp:Transcript_103478/g.301916  ORF Transcript_103478/g.301916 Transcript_103478/m.301916 type:complete len:504 (+) Transcript_103478:121-1632(+)